MKKIIALFILSMGISISYGQEKTPEVLDVGGNPVFPAEYPGGMEAMKLFIYQHICYPGSAMESGIQGKVFVEFMVDSLGNVGRVKIKRGLQEDIDKVAIHAVEQMPQWKPAYTEKKTVEQRFVLPIVFKYEKGKKGNTNYYPAPCK